jgi:hypothetical protein
MRIHLSRDVIRLLYRLRDTGDATLIRAAIELLRRNPDQPDYIEMPEEPGARDMHVRIGDRGYWISYRVKKDRGETEIDIVAVAEN